LRLHTITGIHILLSGFGSWCSNLMCLANDPLTLTHTARTSSKFNLLSLQSPLAKLKKTTELLQKAHTPPRSSSSWVNKHATTIKKTTKKREVSREVTTLHLRQSTWKLDVSELQQPRNQARRQIKEAKLWWSSKQAPSFQRQLSTQLATSRHQNAKEPIKVYKDLTTLPQRERERERETTQTIESTPRSIPRKWKPRKLSVSRVSSGTKIHDWKAENARDRVQRKPRKVFFLRYLGGWWSLAATSSRHNKNWRCVSHSIAPP
jgi:hypothetical protein